MSCFADACALVVYLGAGGRGMSAAGMAAMRQRPMVSTITIWQLRYKAALGKLPPLPLANGSFVQHLIGLGFHVASFEPHDGEHAAHATPIVRSDPASRG